MSQVTVSSNYRITIPREVREKLNIRKGQKLIVRAVDNSVLFVPERDIRELRGMLSALTTEGLRDEEDRY